MSVHGVHVVARHLSLAAGGLAHFDEGLEAEEVVVEIAEPEEVSTTGAIEPVDDEAVATASASVFAEDTAGPGEAAIEERPAAADTAAAEADMETDDTAETAATR